MRIKVAPSAEYVSIATVRDALRLVPTGDWPPVFVRPFGSTAQPEPAEGDMATRWVNTVTGRHDYNDVHWDGTAGHGRRTYRNTGESNIMFVRDEPCEVLVRTADVEAAKRLLEPETVRDFSNGPFVDAERAARRLVDLGVASESFPWLYMRHTEESEDPKLLPNDDHAQRAYELAQGGFGGWVYRQPMTHLQTVSVELYFRKDAYDACLAASKPRAVGGAKQGVLARAIQKWRAKHPSGSFRDFWAAIPQAHNWMCRAGELVYTPPGKNAADSQRWNRAAARQAFNRAGKA